MILDTEGINSAERGGDWERFMRMMIFYMLTVSNVVLFVNKNENDATNVELLK
jgi:hypothetical protein